MLPRETINDLSRVAQENALPEKGEKPAPVAVIAGAAAEAEQVVAMVPPAFMFPFGVPPNRGTLPAPWTGQTEKMFAGALHGVGGN